MIGENENMREGYTLLKYIEPTNSKAKLKHAIDEALAGFGHDTLGIECRTGSAWYESGMWRSGTGKINTASTSTSPELAYRVIIREATLATSAQAQRSQQQREKAAMFGLMYGAKPCLVGMDMAAAETHTLEFIKKRAADSMRIPREFMMGDMSDAYEPSGHMHKITTNWDTPTLRRTQMAATLTKKTLVEKLTARQKEYTENLNKELGPSRKDVAQAAILFVDTGKSQTVNAKIAADNRLERYALLLEELELLAGETVTASDLTGDPIALLNLSTQAEVREYTVHINV